MHDDSLVPSDADLSCLLLYLAANGQLQNMKSISASPGKNSPSKSPCFDETQWREKETEASQASKPAVVR